MQLRYRGISYNYTPATVATTESTATGTYRGLDCRFRNRKQAPVLQPTRNLTYRGVRYQTGADDRTTQEAAPASQPAVAASQATQVLPIAQRSRLLIAERQRTIKLRQQATLSRAAASVGIDSIANYWNRIQGKVHPTFRLCYERSGASLS
ncbi:MAG: DUF4278 domain-containing protein [Coleofasciculaceae cyanobacterium SM2_3_26]|nr:DUF4278 domain-containing protein [Coleofasciculaceae cyanobacterium SM2_3_26]